MQPTLCSKCKKNVAVVFISRMNEKGEPVNEGLCLKCAAQLGLPQVEDMMKRMGITPDDLENLNSEMMQAFGGAEELEDMPEDESGEDEDESSEDNDEISYLDERLFPLMVLTGEAEAAAREHGEEWPEGEERDEMINDCEEDMPQAITDIYRFWLAKRGTETIRREDPKIGRNDPCPCGSGKKFKQCCGLV